MRERDERRAEEKSEGPNGAGTHSLWLPRVADWELIHRRDRLHTRLAARQVEQLDQLSLIGYPTSFDEITRSVVEHTLRLCARTVLG